MLAQLLTEGKRLPCRYASQIMDLQDRHELIWDGKTQNPLPVPPRFKLTEHKSSGSSSFFAGDNTEVFAQLMTPSWQKQISDLGGLKLVYIDPPFDVGSVFHKKQSLGTQDLEVAAYSDRWGAGAHSFIQMLYDRLRWIHELLDENGTLFLHCDHRTSGLSRMILDEIFGAEHFINEIIWSYGLGGSSKRFFPRKHDTIFWYSKSNSWFFNPPLVPATSQRLKGKLKKCPDTWSIPSLNNMAKERTGYPTQKPKALLRRIIQSASQEGDLVADFFAGSGTTLSVAHELNRSWIGCDRSPIAIHTLKKRLLEENIPFKWHAKPDDSSSADLNAQIHLNGQHLEVEILGWESQKGARWQDELDYWTVDWNYDKVYESRWLGTNETTSPAFPIRDNISVQAVDIWGTCRSVSLSPRW